MINVVIAGPYHAICRGLKEILEQESDIKVVGEARSVLEVSVMYNQRNCDVFVLDFDFERHGALDMLKELTEQCPALPIIVMSIHSEEQFAYRVLLAGAKRFLAKDSISETVVEAVRNACDGGRRVGAARARETAPQET